MNKIYEHLNLGTDSNCERIGKQGPHKHLITLIFANVIKHPFQLQVYKIQFHSSSGNSSIPKKAVKSFSFEGDSKRQTLLEQFAVFSEASTKTSNLDKWPKLG